MKQIYQRYFAVLIAIIILIIDVKIPLGVAVGVLYLVPIYFFVKKSIVQESSHYWFIIICSLLVVLGYYVSPKDGVYWAIIVNRLLSIFIIWISYIFFVSFFKSKEKVIKINEELNLVNNNLREITNNAPLIILKTNLKGELLYLNKTLSKNVDLKKIIGSSIFDYIPEDQHDFIRAKQKEAIESKKTCSYTTQASKVDGGVAYVNTSVTPLFYRGRESELLLISEDITEQKEMEAELKRSLKEKEVLLSEIHHRVKNNLQVIWGLLDLQERRTNNSEVVDALSDSKNRINTIALIHESLYKSENFSMINFSDYITQLVENIQEMKDYQSIKVKLKIEELNIPIEISVPLGLIINEIITNSFKHAFIESKHGIVIISLNKENNKIKIVVEDDGIGFNEEEVNNKNSLGIKLINNLCKQIDAELKVITDHQKGTKYQIRFNEK